MTVGLRPMRDNEFAPYLDAAKAQYAQDMVDNAGFTPEAAQSKADRDFSSMFPDGLETPRIFLRVVEADGAPVGHLLFAEREQHGRRAAWLYEVFIDADQRGRGLGRRAMELLEREVAARGLSRIELNVFGGNSVARGLYGSLGYQEIAVVMEKDLG